MFVFPGVRRCKIFHFKMVLQSFFVSQFKKYQKFLLKLAFLLSCSVTWPMGAVCSAAEMTFS